VKIWAVSVDAVRFWRTQRNNRAPLLLLAHVSWSPNTVFVSLYLLFGCHFCWSITGVGILIGVKVTTNDANVFHLRLFFRLSAFCIEVFLSRSLTQHANVYVSLYVRDVCSYKIGDFCFKTRVPTNCVIVNFELLLRRKNYPL